MDLQFILPLPMSHPKKQYFTVQSCELAKMFNRIKFAEKLRAEFEFFIFNFASSSWSSVIVSEFILSSSNFVKFWVSLKLDQRFSRLSSGIFVF